MARVQASGGNQQPRSLTRAFRSFVAVPEYEVVRVTSRIPARGDLAGGGTPTTSTTSTTAAPRPPEQDPEGARRGAADGAAAGVSRVVELAAFGRQHQLKLRPAEGLLSKDLRVFVADSAADRSNGTDIDYTELAHVSNRSLIVSSLQGVCNTDALSHPVTSVTLKAQKRT